MRESKIRQVIRAILAESAEDHTPDLDRFKPAIVRLLRSAIDEARQVFADDLAELELVEQDKTRQPHLRREKLSNNLSPKSHCVSVFPSIVQY